MNLYKHEQLLSSGVSYVILEINIK